jgi:hypothetical protein
VDTWEWKRLWENFGNVFTGWVIRPISINGANSVILVLNTKWDPLGDVHPYNKSVLDIPWS